MDEKQCQETIDQAREVREEALDQIEKAYQKAITPAREARREALDQVWKVYREVRAKIEEGK